MLIGVCLLWEWRVGYFGIFVFAVPMWLSVLFVMVRIAPYVMPPRLEVRDSGSFTTLGLLH